MSEFNLYSVDWQSVSLLHGEHLSSETAYLEQMQRWALRYGRSWGVIELGTEDLQVHGSASDYEITLGRCKAITRGGFLIDINQDRSIAPLQGSNDRHRDAVVTIYLGVARIKETIHAAPAQSAALLETRALQWNCALSCERDAAERDWLAVGRMRREGTRFVRDEGFIPECVYLNSHATLRTVALEIRDVAERGIQLVAQRVRGQKGAEHLAWRTLAGHFAAAMAPAAVLVDWRASPPEYLERLTAVLRAEAALIHLIEAENSDWADANDRLQDALQYIGYIGSNEGNREWFWAEAFWRVRDALTALVKLIGSLTPVGAEALAPPDNRSSSVRILPIKRT